MSPVIAPWASGAWFVFPRAPQSCDEQLEYQEDLLCIADKLSEVADTVKPLYWDRIDGVAPPFSSIPQGPWLIPPQADKDKFIVRDLAINVLAHVARLDARPMTNGTTTGVCSQLYAETRLPSTVTSRATLLFGVGVGETPIYPPAQAPVAASATIHALADDRLQFEAHVLRASGRLLHDLVRDSVFADMAGAEQRASRAIDPLKGNQIAWGLADAENGPYNSLVHAARVLYGRLELGPFGAGDPKCAGVPSLGLNAAYGHDVSARHTDLPLDTNGRAAAATLIEKTGIVIPGTVLAATSSEQLKAFIADQVLGAQAHDNGVTVADLGVQGDAVKLAISRMADADLRFAADRAFHTYRLIANEADIAAMPVVPGGGLTKSPFVAGSLPSGADVIAGGLSRARLSSEAIARVGGLMEASECSDEQGYWGAALADGQAYWPSWTPEVRRKQRAMLQDPFNLGQAFFRRLVVLREEANAGGFHPNAEGVARGGYAEVKTWAGGERVVVNSEDNGPGELPDYVSLVAIGFDSTVTGVASSPNQPSNLDAVDLELVYGPPWVAECAARLRGACPANFDADYVQHATDAFASDTQEVRRQYGTTGPLTQITFDFKSGTAPRFNPSFKDNVGTDPIGNDHLYLIGRHDPTQPGRGWIMGVISLHRVDDAIGGGAETSTGFVVAPMQRELANGLLGVGGTPTKPDVGTDPASKGPSFCLDGVPRDIFVPLENELTSDADPYENSWRHYLNLAKASAQRADELGQQLVQLDVQEELRREAASESLSEVCGDPATVSKVTIAPDGKVVSDPADASLDVCINEPSVDIAFLGPDPRGKTSEKESAAEAAASTAYIKDRFLHCATDGISNELCKKAKITHTGLNLVPATPAPDVSACTGVQKVLSSLRGEGGGLNDTEFGNVAASDWASPGAFTSTADVVRMRVEASPIPGSGPDTNGDWSVRVGGAIVMNSGPGNLWPGCLAPPMSCHFDSMPLNLAFNRLFRHCEPNPNDDAKRKTTPLGGCGADGIDDAFKARAELNALSWRVQGALWLLGSIGGHLPDGMFDVPVVVADHGAPGWAGIPFDPESLGEYSGLDSFVTNASTGVSNPVLPFDVVNQNALGGVFAISHQFAVHDPGMPGLPPGWFRTLTLSGKYRYARAQTPALNATKFADIAPGSFGARYALNIGPQLGGAYCPRPGGDYVNPPATTTNLTLGLAAAKLNLDGPSDAHFARLRVVRANDGTDNPDLHYGVSNSAAIARSESEPGLPAPYCELPLLRTVAGSVDAKSAPPSERAVAAVNSGSPCSPCEAAHQLVQAYGLNCYLQTTGVAAAGSDPPPIRTVDDLPALESWIANEAISARQQVGVLFLQSVPTRVVDDLAGGRVGTGSAAGAHGAQLLQVEEQLQTLVSSWNSVTTDLSGFKSALTGTRLALSAASVEKTKELLNLNIQEFRVYRDMVASAGSVLSSVASGPTGIAGSSIGTAATVTFGGKELAAIGELKDDADKSAEIQVNKALNDLRTSLGPTWNDMEKNLGSIRASVGGIRAATEALQSLQKKAQYEAAKATGADFVTVGGKVTLLPVNVVLRRQYDATARRYREALKQAQYQAYLARRAIEQRIGVELDTIVTPVGTLDAPVKWSNDLCRVVGLDYAKLLPRDADGGILGVGPGADAAVDNAIVDSFADQFIGDYVQKLDSFVEYYNVEYPSHDGDDTAVLSLRDDLLAASGYCLSDSPNLLFYSDKLSTVVSTTPESPEHRWQLHRCAAGATKCLSLLSGAALALPKDPPDVSGHGGVTWLRDQSASTSTGTLDGPPGLLSQTVSLNPGTYVLSWWDQARTATGELATSSSTPYRVAVYDSSFAIIVGDSPTASIGTAASPWSTRRTMAITIAAKGDYHVAFGASGPADAVGSIALADVQLEPTPAGGAASPYVGTDGTRTVVSNVCKVQTGGDLRAAFDYRCTAPGVCFYDLDKAFVIDTGTLGTPTTALQGKIAAGNFNYRHIDVSLNLVGTGVRDCGATPTPSCYGSGFTEFTLNHDAHHSGIVGYGGTVQFFDFGDAPIEHGKALSAERYITMPVGSGDLGLLSQPGILKPEFRGRPLDGSYRLKIWDSPALKWSRLEDIQVILHYRYWSRINKSPSK